MHIKISSKRISDIGQIVSIPYVLLQSSRVLLLLSLVPFPHDQPHFHFFSSCFFERAISCRNAGIRDENWYRSHVKSIIATATNSPSILRYRIPRHQRSYLPTSRSSPRELSPCMAISSINVERLP